MHGQGWCALFSPDMLTAMAWQLTAIAGDAVPHRVNLDGPAAQSGPNASHAASTNSDTGTAIDIGRDPHCDVRLLDDRSSRFHARVLCDQLGLLVVDLSSSNGSYINEQRLSGDDSIRLRDGDLLRCGAVTFVVTDLTSAAHATRVVTDSGAALDITAKRSNTAPSHATAARTGQSHQRAESLQRVDSHQRADSLQPVSDPPQRPSTKTLSALSAAHRCLLAVAEAQPAHRGQALANTLAEVLRCPQAAVVVGGRVQACGMSARLARRLATGPDARLLVLGRELVGQTVAAEAVGSAASAPLGEHGHVIVARGVDHEALNEDDLDVVAAVAADAAAHFTAGDAHAPQLAALVGSSTIMQQLRARIARIAAADTTVLVTGESGTGKELVARALHACSGRADGPWVAINCAAVSDNLFEAELFGHAQGAYTGADQAREGRFVEADGGTLFLDEVGELPERMQAKLLRVLQEGVVETVGGAARPVDVRIVAATNRDLQHEVSGGRFRADLYYRLDVIRIHTPALRDHPTDIPELAVSLLTRSARETGIAPGQLGLSADALKHIQHQAWPGNVRQLANILTRGLVLSGGHIEPEHLELSSDLPATLPSDPDAPFPSLSEMEAAHVAAALQRTEGNRSAAARLLGISRPTLLKKITDYGLS